MPGMSEPVALASGWVRVEYHAFHLADAGQYDPPPFHPHNGLIFSRPGLAVVLVGANLAVEAPAGVRLVSVQTAAELEVAATDEFRACDVLLLAAAVADFKPA